MDKKREVMRHVWPVLMLLVMVVIYYSSSRTGEASGGASMAIIDRVLLALPFLPFGEDTLHYLLRKGAHFTVFFTLGFCTAQAIKYEYGHGLRLFASAWGFAALYGVVDEVHQSFVPGRACEFTDMLINAAGALLGVLLVLLLLKRAKKRREPAPAVTHILDGSDSSPDRNHT